MFYISAKYEQYIQKNRNFSSICFAVHLKVFSVWIYLLVLIIWKEMWRGWINIWSNCNATHGEMFVSLNLGMEQISLEMICTVPSPQYWEIRKSIINILLVTLGLLGHRFWNDEFPPSHNTMVLSCNLCSKRNWNLISCKTFSYIHSCIYSLSWRYIPPT